MATAIVLLLIFIAVIIAIIKIVKDKAKGKCTGCPYSGQCSKHSCSEK
ncbi:MAG: FeoB-associated Cys-rich membrane protein [Treponema sp.]|nr:FeoB-associated Cys-rich membrane protein [Treponema sp.]